MCLNIDQYETNRVKDIFKRIKRAGEKSPNHFTTYFKVYRRTPAGYLKSLVQGQCIKKARVVKSNRKSKRLTKEEQRFSIINKGIHVYRNYRRAEGSSFSWDGDRVIIPVKCYAKDFIAASENEAVFMKVEITKEAWDTKVFNTKVFR